MKIVYSIFLVFALTSCDNGLQSNRSKSNSDSKPNAGPAKGKQAQSDDQFASRNSDAGTNEDGLVMNLPDSVDQEPLPQNSNELFKNLMNPGELIKIAPDLFDFANKMLPQGFAQPMPPSRPPMMAPYPCPMYVADGSTDMAAPEFMPVNKKITYECKSEELTDGYYGYISSHIIGEKIDHCYANSHFGAEMVKCKSFIIKLPALKDGTYDLQAFFVSADKKSQYHGRADPKLEIVSGKLTSTSKIVMKKKVTDSSGSVAVEFEE